MSAQAPAAPGAPGAPAAPGAASGFLPPSVALCTVGLAMASFMQVLDTTIANVSLPTIAGNLGASSQQATWVITSFAVSTAIALPLTGWLSRRFGERKLFVWATLAFVITSLLCGLAQSMGMLVLSRALQGFVAGPMYPITQSLLVSIYPREKRGQALALLAMITVVAPICGPILGGWITDNYSWEWIFLINVPLGIFAALVVGNQLKGRPEHIEKPKMDYVGLVTLVIGVGALQLVLDLGNDEDWFSSMKIVVLACVAVVTLTVFLIWELTDKDPIVDLKLFRHRNFRAGTLAMVVAYAAFFSVALLIPQWLQRDMGYTAIWAGLATAPIGILPVIMTPVMFIPFILVQPVLTIITSLAYYSGLIPPITNIAPWTMPVGLGAFFNTNGSIMAMLLSLFNLAVATVIYLPFVAISNKAQSQIDAATESEEDIAKALKF